jgi:hypothetical protein
MSPEEWLAQQAKDQPPAVLSPQDWLAQQSKEQPQAPLSPEMWMAKQPKTQIAEPEEGDFMRGLGNVPGQIQSTYGGAKALAGLLTNSKDLVQSGLESMEEGKFRQTSKESDSFTNAWQQGIGTVLTDWLPYQMGSGVGNLAETGVFMLMGGVAGAATGAGLGAVPGALAGVVSKTLIKQGIKDAAEEIAKKSGKEAAQKYVEAQTKKALVSAGKTAGMVSQAGMHGAGEVTGRAIEEAEKVGKTAQDIDLGRVVPAAIAHGIADFVINKIGLNSLKIGEKSLNNFALDVATRIVVTGAKETPAELVQTAAERYGAKLSLTDAEAITEYVDTTAAAFGMSVGPGAVGGARTNLSQKFAKAAKEDTTPEEQLRQLSTSAAGQVQTAPPPASPELVSGLTPALNENNQSLAKVSADTTKAGQELKVIEDAKAAEEAGKIKTAGDLLAKVDAGEKVTRNDITSIGKELGIKFPFSANSNQAKIDIIREHLAGAPNVAGTNIDTSGGSPEVAALSSADQTAAGTVGSQSRGMVSTGTNAGTNLDRTVQQPFALNAGAQSVIISNLDQGATVDQVRSLFPATGELANEVFTFAATYNLASEKLKTGSSPEEVIAVFDSGPATLAAIKKFSPQGTTSGTTTPQAQQTTAQGQAATTPAGPISLGDLAPEIQDSIMTRRDALYEMETEGVSQKKIASAYRALNQLEELHGIDITKPSTLSARSNEQPAYQGTDLQGALELANQYEKQDEQERQAALDESLGKGQTRYDQENLPPNTEDNYNAVAEELSAKAETANATRSELAKRAEDLNKQHSEAAAEAQRIEDAIDEAERKGDQKKLDALREQENENNRRESDLLGELVDAQTALQEHGPVQFKPLAWDKLNSADKDIYFSYIRNNTPAEHRQAAAALLAAKNKAGVKSREGEGKLDPKERRTAQNYEDNRAQMGKIFGVQFPTWERLTNAAKAVFLRQIVNNAGLQQDVGFAKLGVQLIQENQNLDVNGKAKELANIEKRQKEIQAEAEQNKQKLEKLQAAYDRNKTSGVPGTYLPGNIIKMIQSNNLQGVLQYLRSGPKEGGKEAVGGSEKFLKALAQTLFSLKLATNIKYVESLPNDDLAQYDASTDTIYVTAQGLTASTVLHEVVHAATAKIINLYMTGKFKQLTEDQIRAVEHLEAMMYEAAVTLATTHRNAFEVVGKNADGSPRYSLMEFLSYSMTDEAFQIDLIALQPPKESQLMSLTGEVATNLPEQKSMWSDLAMTIAKIIGLDKVYFQKNKVRADAPYNYLIEVTSSLSDILAKPTEPIYLSPFSAKKPPTPKPALTKHKAELGVDNTEFHLTRDEAPPTWRDRLSRMKGNVNTWRNGARIWQDDRYFIKAQQRVLEMSNKIIREGKDKINNVYEQIVMAVGDGKNFFNVYVSQPARELDAAVKEFAEGAGYKTKRALEELHKILEATHEPERRMVKYLLSVPLSIKNNLSHNGKQINAAQRREDIRNLLDNYTLTQAQAQQLREELESIVFEKNANGQLVLDPEGYPKPNMKYVDPLGSSPKPRKQKGNPSTRGIIYVSDDYNATGIDLEDAKKIREQLKTHPQAESIQKVINALQQLHTATAEMNKLANYWSQPVSNRVAFYGFKNYVPLKGNPKHTEVDEEIEFDSRRNGRELQDNAGAMGGRTSVSINPVLQTMTDATRAALRAGRRNLTQSIKNSLKADKEYNPNGQGLIEGYVKKRIKFEERDTVDLSELKGETTIFHYNEDGSIDILVVTDKKLRDSIRRTYQKSSSLTEFANKWTSRIGQMHTRYNYNFAPLNFTRDVLTNTWNIGASGELGPLEAARYLKDVSFLAANGGMYKAMQVAILFPKGDTQSLRALKVLSEKDPYIRDMVEYIRQGGMVSHLNGMSLQSNFEELHKKVGQSGVLTSVEDINQFADVWTNMFELASRAAAYSVAKNKFIQQGESEESAKMHAGVFTKNLANFEQVGELGKAFGALYMFFRPAATGAVRAIEAVAPAFISLKEAESRLPPSIRNDKAATATYLKNFQKDKTNATRMSLALFGLGMAAYTMAFMTADDDDLGRNAVATDNMEQWTRFARFHIPRGISEAMGMKDPLIFQIPWGFGLGSFAAAGAQIAGVLGGSQKITEALPNIFTSIVLDSFVPIPVSRIPISDPANIPYWILDTAAPSIFRPILEFAMNKNGLGHDINSAAQRRLGDAYTGGDNIPEAWKDFAVWAHDATDGYIDVSPNTLYFLANSYADGVSRIGETMYGLTDVAQDRKDFSPKTDLPLLGSFFGSRASYDAREFAKVEKEIKHMEKVINDFKTQPVKYAEYTAKYPLDEAVVEIYNKMLNKELNPLRAQDKTVRLDKNLSPADRKALLQMNQLNENLVKRQMIDAFKAYDVEP